MPVFHDLEEAPPFFIGKRVYPPVVYNKEPYPLEPGQKFHKASVRLRNLQLLRQPRQPYVGGAYALPYGAVCQSASQISLPGARRPDDYDVLVAVYPFVLGESQDHVLRKTPPGPEVQNRWFWNIPSYQVFTCNISRLFSVLMFGLYWILRGISGVISYKKVTIQG